MAGNLQVKISTNQAFPATLTRDDYLPMLAFLRQSRVSHAISRDIQILPSAVQEFYRNMHREVENGIEILRTEVNGLSIDITITEIRRIL